MKHRFLIIPVLLACILAIPPTTQAHKAYSEWLDEYGKSCCDDKDCRPVKWRYSFNGSVEMFISKEWVLIEPSKLSVSPDHRAHWCGAENFEKPSLTLTYCASIPAGIG